MIKLFSLKQQKKDGESPRSGPQKKASAAQLRIQKGTKKNNQFINESLQKMINFILCQIFLNYIFYSRHK